MGKDLFVLYVNLPILHFIVISVTLIIIISILKEKKPSR